MLICKNDIYLDYFIDKILKGVLIITPEGHVFKKEKDKYRPFGVITSVSSSCTKYLKFNYKGKSVLAHRVLFKYYNGYIDSSLSVNHIDGNGLNNSKHNLELVNMSDQLAHKYRVLKYPAVIGNNKIDKTIADMIRSDRLNNNLTYKQLCNKYKLCKSSISYIINNKTWK